MRSARHHINTPLRIAKSSNSEIACCGVVYWPILEDRLEQVGMTVHFMDTGVDTGDILRIKNVDIESSKSIKHVRDRFEPIVCREMVQTCVDYLVGKIERIPQKKKDGQQYYVMHPRLLELTKGDVG